MHANAKTQPYHLILWSICGGMVLQAALGLAQEPIFQQRRPVEKREPTRAAKPLPPPGTGAPAAAGPSSSGFLGPAPAPPPETSPALSATSPLPPHLLLSVRTDKAVYKSGERVHINGKIVTLAGTAGPAIVEIKLYPQPGQGAGSPGGDPLYTAVLETRPTDTTFADEAYTVQLRTPNNIRDALLDQSAAFFLQAKAWPQGQDKVEAAVAATSFVAEDVGYWLLIKLIGSPVVVGLGFLVVSLAVFMTPPTKPAAKQALWLVYGSGLCFLLIALGGPLLISISPATEALMRTTPVGISQVTTDRIKDLQWVINVGGTVTADGTLKGGFGVPLYVIIWSVVGGVISMLLKLPGFLRQYDALAAGTAHEPDQASQLREDVFRCFVYILTGPFLGMMAYSLVALADYVNPMSLSILAFSVGFVSDRIVETLLAVADSLLKPARDRGPATKPEAEITAPKPETA